MGNVAARTVRFAVRGPIERSDLPGLTARVCRLLSRARATTAYCDVTGVDQVDAVAVEALLRLHLAARRSGCEVRLHGASAQLRELVAFIGLADVLLPEPPS